MLYEHFASNQNDLFIFRRNSSTILARYPFHIHYNFELIFLRKGTLNMHIGNDLYHLSSGDFAIVFPNIMHKYYPLSLCDNLELLIINCSLHYTSSIENYFTKAFPLHPVLTAEELPKEAKWALDIIWDEEEVFNNKSIQLKKGYFFLIFSSLLDKLQLQSNSSHMSDSVTESIVHFMEKHFQEKLTLSMVAKHFGIGESTLSRIFSNELKLSFPNYLNILRVNHIETELLTTQKTISQITYENGFQNQQTFNRVFKKMTGFTPSEYRRYNSA